MTEIARGVGWIARTLGQRSKATAHNSDSAPDYLKQHFLYLSPLPQGHRSFRPSFRRLTSRECWRIVRVAFVDTSSSVPLIRAGKLRALAISGTRRGPATPEVRTMTEQGYPFETNSWYGMFAPAGTSAAIVQRLNAEVNRILTSPDMRERFLLLNMAMPPVKTPEQFAQTVRDDVSVWGNVIRTNHITVD